MTEKLHQINIAVPKEIAKKLNVLAAKIGTNRKAMIANILTNFVNENYDDL